ncbi:MAG: efflux RND transporter periplasmic adaptor subunit [Xanthomonadales bacterium]|nr:efflux RND transporter periplasmic adaptor subunit [Xanthomonadales bacterium]
MRKYLKYILPLGLILASIAVVVVMIEVAKSQRPERAAEVEPAVLVDAIAAEVRSLNLYVHSQGSVRPRTETTVVAEVSGKIVEVSPNFIAGGFFRKGEVLLQIDASDYETALKRAQAELASRHAQYSDQLARSEQAMRDWQNLGRTGEPSELTLRKPQLAEALANVQAAEANLQKAQRDLQRTRISLPYDGLVRSKMADIGQYVAPGTSVGVTFAIETAEIRLPLSASDVAYLELPSATGAQSDRKPAVILTSELAGTRTQWHGEIIRTEGVIDEASRVTYAVAQVVDPYGVLGRSDQAILPVGTFVRAAIEGRRAENVVVLPRSVLRPDDTVLIANERNELEIRPVQVLRAEPRLAYISSGIRDGELVVTTALDAPIPGTRLAINEGQDVETAAQRSDEPAADATISPEALQ